LRLLGRAVKLSDGNVGRVTGSASQQRRLMVKVQFKDGSIKWAHACDVTLVEADEAAPPPKGRRR